MNEITVTVSSYKKATVFKKDYVRKAGKFAQFEKTSGNHAQCTFVLKNGEEFDARGSIYQDGATKWTAASCQSWAKFKNVNGELKAFDFEGIEIPLPPWASSHAAKLQTT